MALNPLVSLIGRLLARSGRKRGYRQTDGQTRRNDKTTTVTLAAHARRGLMTSLRLALALTPAAQDDKRGEKTKYRTIEAQHQLRLELFRQI